MKKLLLILIKGFEPLEASAFMDVFGWNQIEGDSSVKLFTCGFTKNVCSAFGQTLIVDKKLQEINVNDFDALAIPGGFGESGYYEEGFSEQIMEIVQSFNNQNKLIASVCTGSLILAKSGILQSREATTYNGNKLLRQKQLESMGVKVLNTPIVKDGNLISSWNPSTAVSVAFLLLECMTDEENAAYIREIMGFKKQK